MWLSRAQLATLLFALTAASFGILALTLLGITRGRRRLALYAVLALGVATLLAAPLLFDAATRPRVETALGVSLPLVAAAFLAILARGGRGTRAFLFAAFSVLVLSGSAELAARRQVLLVTPAVTPLGVGFVLFTALLLPRVAEQERRLFTRATTDPLTGLANKVTFERMLELEIARAMRQETQLGVLLFDVDGFAEINDKGGARAGDEVLRHVAATLAGQVRLVDTVARFGPDEFALIAPGGAGQIAGRRVRDALAGTESVTGPISISVGAAVYPIDGATSEELLDAAGRALAEAKRRGRGSIFVASGS